MPPLEAFLEREREKKNHIMQTLDIRGCTN